MTSQDEIDAIREQKRKALESRLDQSDSNATGSTTPTDPVHITSATRLSDITNTNRIVLVDFFAEWCGPCKMLEPTLDELAAESEAAIAKVDIDQHQQLATQYGVQGVPNLILFVDGSPAERVVGVQPKAQFEQLIARHA
ncbi:thioredoxin [Natronocalculus amylovorans]|uniref:Thioredoxin n=1 Tax=Natronocalculus amylovorans TaxID=2917812 RepID=A0AAE3FY77_9EURY|nr:thioredoxin [Natronocalculus amylovorans]MCL9817568.1 thioredoxin [Natronocalculus amylovorans]